MEECTSGGNARDRIASCSEIISVFDGIRNPDASDRQVAALALAWRGTAQLYQGADRFASAVADLNRSISLQVDHRNVAYCFRTEAHYFNGQYQLGLGDVNKCIAAYPSYGRGWANRGWLQLELNQNYESVASFTKALETYQTARTFEGRAEAHQATGAHKEAIADYTSAIGASENPKQSYFVGRARSSMFLKNYIEAAADYTRALQGKQSAPILEYRGFAYLNASRMELALADFTKAIEVDSASPTAHYGLGRVKEQSNNTQEAAIDYLASLRLVPRPGDNLDDFALKMARQRLEVLASNSPSSEQEAPSAKISAGTGFFVSSAGHVLTNAHVVEGCGTVSVEHPGGRTMTSQVLARDVKNDLALLAAWSPPIVATFGDRVRTGDQVAAFGFPLAGLLSSSGNFSLGNVTATSGLGDDPRMLQISAPVQAGNSGGPLLDMKGNVVGVIVAKLDAALVHQKSGDLAQNVNFAINDAVARAFLENQGVRPQNASSTRPLSPADVADKAKAITLFLHCSPQQ
jgi:S1-C subfamily serine protease